MLILFYDDDDLAAFVGKNSCLLDKNPSTVKSHQTTDEQALDERILEIVLTAVLIILEQLDF